MPLARRIERWPPISAEPHRPSAFGTLLAILALAAPTTALAADFTVETIPGAGWVQGPDNTAGLAARLVEGPGADIEGTGSVELATAGDDRLRGHRSGDRSNR